MSASSASPEEKEAEKDKKGSRIVALPIAFYTPETKFALGFGGSYIFDIAKNHPSTRPSKINTVGIITMNKQFQLFLMPDLYLKNNSYHVRGNFGFSYFNDKFWGIGPDTKEDMEEAFTSRDFLIIVDVQKKIYSHLEGGLGFDFGYSKVIKTDEGGLLESGEIMGSEGGPISGLGFFLSWDSRDNIHYSREGSYHQASAKFYRRAFGSDYVFDKYVIDLRKFFPVFDSHSIALQGFFSFINGGAPFQLLSRLGGQNLMRGYWNGRFRDNHMMAVQAEYRIQLGKKFGVVGFAGVGDVADELGNFNFDPIKYSMGLGVRYTLKTKDKINLRLDVGFTGEGQGIYITALEAF